MAVESPVEKSLAPEPAGKSRSEWGVLGGLFLLSIAARLCAACFIGLSYPMDNDEPDYYEMAVHVADGDGFGMRNPYSASHAFEPMAYRLPGTAIVLGAGFKILNHQSLAAARLISAFISSFAAPLMYLLVRRSGMRSAALTAGIACAIYPTYVYFSLKIFSEPYFVPMLLLSLIATIWAIESPKKWPALVAGLVWGLTGMIRPHAFPVVALILVYLLARKEWKRGVYLAVGAWMILGVWATRNQIVLGHPVLLATEGGETLLGANNPHVLTDPDGLGLWKSAERYPEYKAQVEGLSSEFDRNDKFNQLAKDYLWNNPGDIPSLVLNKLVSWLRPVPKSGGLIRLLVIVSYDLLLILLAIGLWTRHIKRSLLLDLVLMVTFVFTLVTCVYWGNLTRGRLPLEIIWIPWGAAVACSLFDRVVSRKNRHETI